MQFQRDKSLSTLSTFGIGGKARYFTRVESIQEMQETLYYCHAKNLPFIIVGRGSNCLFDDRGYNGLVILNKITFCTYADSVVSVGAGYQFSLLGVQSARKGLSGLEFANGIPGSVGGAIVMNAGAGGNETKDTLLEVSFVDERADLQVFQKSQLEFSYRSSIFQKKKGAIVSGKFLLEKKEGLWKKQKNLLSYRIETQPYREKSCGCVFRNPKGESAAALIESCGLKGKKIGGAEVSTMHANFIVNKKNASAQDVKRLISVVKETVKEQTGRELEMELCLIPYGF